MKKYIIFLTLLFTLFSCSQKASQTETINDFLTLMEDRNFYEIGEVNSLFREISQDDLIKMSQALTPYYGEGNNLTFRQQGLGRAIVFLSNNKEPGKSVIFSLEKGEGNTWKIKEKISYQQSIDFIPLERELPISPF